MNQKTSQLQIRVTPAEKSALQRLARAAGQGMSAYVLARALPQNAEFIADLIDGVGDAAQRSYALAELNDWLTACTAYEYREIAPGVDVGCLKPVWQNYVAAMFELAAGLKETAPPVWTRGVVPLDEPWFATSLRSLRLHLLTASPTPFKRRNLFVDSSLGARV